VATLITLQEAKSHLRVTGDDENADIEAKLQEACDLVLKHLNTGAVAGWSNGTVAVPGNVKAAVCLMLTYLYELRGEAMDPSANVWIAIERVLTVTRVSALA
jgi:hypothetical protein